MQIFCDFYSRFSDFGGHFEMSSVILEFMITSRPLLMIYKIHWPYKYGYKHHSDAARSFHTQHWMILVVFGGHFDILAAILDFEIGSEAVLSDFSTFLDPKNMGIAI